MRVAQHLARRVAAVRAGDAAARMRPRAAQVQATDRRPVVRVPAHRTHEQQLVGRHVAVQRVAARAGRGAAPGRAGSAPGDARSDPGASGSARRSRRSRRSARSSLIASHSASRRSYGCEFTSIVTMCLPSGASDGSCTVGKQSSMCAGSAGTPATRLRLLDVQVGMNGFSSMIPRWYGCAPPSGGRAPCGSSDTARLIFMLVPMQR